MTELIGVIDDAQPVIQVSIKEAGPQGPEGPEGPQGDPFEPLIDVPGDYPTVKTQTVTIEEDCLMIAALKNWQSQGQPTLTIEFYINGVSKTAFYPYSGFYHISYPLSAGDELYVQVRIAAPPRDPYSGEGEVYIAFAPSPSFIFELEKEGGGGPPGHG
jgi:hypothetical protein